MKLNTLLVACLAGAAATPAMATDGYFSHGYGMTAKGMGGAATAMAKDTFGGANNPASMVWVGDRVDAGVDWFSPKRDVSRTGSSGNGTGMDGSVQSGHNNFFIPEFGYNTMLSSTMSAGVTVYGNGGMNTDYAGGQIAASASNACGAPYPNGFNPGGAAAGPFNLLCGSGKLGIDMMQLIIAPTFAMKVNPSNSIGISPLIGFQRFKAVGLQAFVGFTPNPLTNGANLTDQGYDTAHGYGVRVGWMGKLNDAVTLGAAYSTKLKMSKFDKYADLFAGQGGFDMPANYNLGVAFKAAQGVTVALDYQRIEYSGIPSVANPSTNTGNSAGPGYITGSLGCDNCRGFGWQDANVVKLGVEYQYSPILTLRAGWNHTDNPIQARDVTFNIIAPGVVQDHLTLGFSYSMSKDSDLTMAYMHAFQHSVTGSSLFNNWLGDQAQEKIQMHQDALGIAYSWKM